MLGRTLLIIAMLTSSALADQLFKIQGSNDQSANSTYSPKDRSELKIDLTRTTQIFGIRSENGEDASGYVQAGNAAYYCQQTYETPNKLSGTPSSLGRNGARIGNSGHGGKALAVWSNQRQYNLMFAALAQRRVHYCATPIRFSGGQIGVSRMIQQAFQEWFAPLNIKIPAVQITAGCRPNIERGVVAVELYGDEDEFVYRTGGGPANTLGIYFPSSGTFMLNMPGILNQNRDSTGGYKTILHELGHVLGMNHSPEMNSVMYYNLRYASPRLSPSDIA